MTTWTMFDARGNLVVGSDVQEPMLILRDPTLQEAEALIVARTQGLLRSGEATTESDALRMALRDLPLHAKIWAARGAPVKRR